jgi:16S rRNA processing protein RimM
VRLWVFVEDPGVLASYGPLESEDGARRFDIEALRPAKGHFVARLSGVRDRDAAAGLNHLRLFVPRERLPPTGDSDTFYHADLIGLTAVDSKGAAIGTVTAVHNFGAGDLLEIAPQDGGDTIMLSFTQATVPAVDIAGGRIVLDPPADADED